MDAMAHTEECSSVLLELAQFAPLPKIQRLLQKEYPGARVTQTPLQLSEVGVHAAPKENSSGKGAVTHTPYLVSQVPVIH
jgi:hypothetical protein